MEQIIIEEPAKTCIVDVNSYELFVRGNAENGTRSITISVNIIDQVGNYVRTVRRIISGTDFNNFWVNFSTDKAAIDQILTDVDTSNVPDNIINVL